MRILFVNESPLVRSGERYYSTEAWSKLILSLAEHAEDSTLLAPVREDPGPPPADTHWLLPIGALQVAGLDFYSSYAGYYRLWPRRARHWARMLDDLMRRHDLVVLRLPSPLAPKVCAAAGRAGRPVVCFVVGDLATQVDGLVSARGLRKAFYRAAVAHFLRQEISCCSGAALVYAYSSDILRRHSGKGVPVKLMQDPHLRAGDIRLRQDTCGGPEILLIRACWVIPSKGLETLIQATALLRGRGLPVRLEIAGRERQAGYQASLERLASGLGLSGIVRFLGWQPFDKVLDLFDRGDVHVVSSLGEGSPRVLAESFARGVPSVCTSVGGCADVLEHGKDALLVPPEDPEAMADAVERLIRDGELRRCVIARGYENVRELTFETLGMRVVADLKGILSRQARP